MEKKFAYVFEGAISPETCAKIIQEGYLYQPVKAAIGFTNANGVDTSYRESIVRWINGGSSPWVRDLIWQYALKGREKIHNNEIQLEGCYQIQFTTYFGAKGGFYNLHHDIDWCTTPLHRKLSIVIQLNNPGVDYEGGDFEFLGGFPHPELQEQMKTQGSILVFPSYLEHRVNRVTKGVRHSLVSWIEGPLWK